MGVINRIKSWIDKESLRSKKNKCVVFIAWLFDYFKYGVNPKEYYMFKFDGKTPEEKKTFFTRQMFRKFLKRNNDPLYRQILNDKYIFSQTFARYTNRKCVRNTNLTFENFNEIFSD